MRCNDCAKFVGHEQGQEPETDIEVSETRTEGELDGICKITGTVKITLTCSECSGELSEHTFDVDVDIALSHKDGCEVEQDISVVLSPDAADKFEPPKAKRQVHYYGAEGTISVTCEGCGVEETQEWSAFVKASEMEKL